MSNPLTRFASLFAACCLLNSAAADTPSSPDNPPGKQPASAVQLPATELYQQHCAQCHEGGVPKAPHSVSFQMMGSAAILNAMNNGAMQAQSAALGADQKLMLAEYLGGSLPTTEDTPPLFRCEPAGATADFELPPGQFDWGLTPGNSRSVTAQDAALTAKEIPDLKLKWAFAYPQATRARSQPTVAGGKIFVGSQDGTVYALDLATGCVHWTFKADAEVRSAITISSIPGESGSTEATAFFGDFVGNVYALNAHTGAPGWKSNLDDHPNVTITGSPKLHKDRLYVPMSSSEWATAADPSYECCTFRGGIVAFDIADGRMVWKSHSIPDLPILTGKKNSQGTAFRAPSGAPIWNSPTIDEKRNLLYVGTGESYSSPAAASSDSVIAFNLDTGAIEWVHQATPGDAWNMACNLPDNDNCPEEDGPDFDIGASPILLTLADGRDVLLVGQKSGHVFALDPDRQGALMWKQRIGLGGFAGGVHWGMAADNDVLFAPNADTNFINKWKGERRPGLFALRADSGEQLWFTPTPDACPEETKPACDPGLSAAVTAIPEAVFAGGFDGHLRAYDRNTGAIIWDFDTAREFRTLSGDIARGGSIESDGPVIVGGTVLINSGYLFGGRMAGNVLLAFSVAGK